MCVESLFRLLGLCNSEEKDKEMYIHIEFIQLLFQYSFYHATPTLPQVNGVPQCRIKGR